MLSTRVERSSAPPARLASALRRRSRFQSFSLSSGSTRAEPHHPRAWDIIGAESPAKSSSRTRRYARSSTGDASAAGESADGSRKLSQRVRCGLESSARDAVTSSGCRVLTNCRSLRYAARDCCDMVGVASATMSYSGRKCPSWLCTSDHARRTKSASALVPANCGLLFSEIPILRSLPSGLSNVTRRSSRAHPREAVWKSSRTIRPGIPSTGVAPTSIAAAKYAPTSSS